MFYDHAISAANGSSGGALFGLGELYQFGLGTERDLVKAMEFHRRAVDLGKGESSRRLAVNASVWTWCEARLWRSA